MVFPIGAAPRTPEAKTRGPWPRSPLLKSICGLGDNTVIRCAKRASGDRFMERM